MDRRAKIITTLPWVVVLAGSPVNAGWDKPFDKGGPLSVDKPFDKGGALSIDKPLPPEIQAEIDKLGPGALQAVQKFGDDTLATFQKTGGDTIRTLQRAAGDTFATTQKAANDSITTTYKAAGDATATYVKGWRDSYEQEKKSFNDAVDAEKAASHFVENQGKSLDNARRIAEKRLRDGKVVDSMWGLYTEPLQSSEENFAKATQESKVVNAAAATAAAVYRGPAGAAAYAAWSTYRQTGNADMALRAGLLAAVTSEAGSSVAAMPSGTTGEIIRKAAVAGAAGGISVAAAGGDEQAIKDGFLKSAGAVLVQGGSDQLKAYSPEAKDAYDTVQCISARDVDCVSNTTWARSAKGKILTGGDGKPVVDPDKLDPNEYVGKWTELNPDSPEGFITQVSKLPKMEAIPILKNKWVLTWNLGKNGNAQNITHGTPTVVLTYVGNDPPFTSTVDYGGGPVPDRPPNPPSNPPSACNDASLDAADVFSDVAVAYYVKPADGSRIANALKKGTIAHTKLSSDPNHKRGLSNALICGADTPGNAIKKVALALINAGVDIKYIGTNNIKYRPRSISILNLHRYDYTVNYPNITCDQVIALAECPDELKNY